MKKIQFTIVLIICGYFFSNAQDYNTGIGLRGGFDNGLTIKHFLSRNSAIEGIIASRWRGLELTGLYEFHGQAFHAERLHWYAGFGAHIGFWNGNNAHWGEKDKSYTIIGVDGIVGLEYNFTEFPFNIGLDWKPALNFYGYSGFWADGGALSIRYIF